MLTGYYQKNKEKLSKRLLEGTKIFLKKKRQKAPIWSQTIQKTSGG